MARLSGKVAVITGAASGMGLSGSQLFAQEGAVVVMTDVSKEALERESAALRETGGTVTAIVLDVSSPESWDAVIEQTLSEHGRIDILVNNAGIHIPKGILEAELEDWNKVMAVNATGVWLGMKSVIPTMQKQGGGSIVNVASIAAFVGGMADAGGAAYSASKGAVTSLTKHAAQWFGKDGVRVNSIHPGAVFTGLAAAAGLTKETMADRFGDAIPLPPHVGEPSDIGYGMLFLASDESKFVTGEELVIDGGWITH
ncbi:glucose 1-dehydrogenase [Rathayibacter caricis]|uniref:SDR family NAD(P)-dependent oxidoreductase n=1 Tax=Rathayibacter caricis TaxID=110936 RepID=UPI001FB396B1|nr:glucose 1-dehydrogenase [Rathayibacter caricis]MCJ1696253.1 glucose 1-dehydrogenase [Rathayibacter caricis]